MVDRHLSARRSPMCATRFSSPSPLSVVRCLPLPAISAMARLPPAYPLLNALPSSLVSFLLVSLLASLVLNPMVEMDRQEEGIER